VFRAFREREVPEEIRVRWALREIPVQEAAQVREAMRVRRGYRVSRAFAATWARKEIRAVRARKEISALRDLQVRWVRPARPVLREISALRVREVFLAQLAPRVRPVPWGLRV